MASSDGSTEWVGPQIATFLNLPVVTMVKEIVDCEGTSWKVKANVENGYRLMQVQLPAVFTVTRELNNPRTLSFSGIIRARKKEISLIGSEQLGAPVDQLGLKGSPTIVSELNAQIESKKQAKIIAGTRDEKADMLVQKLVEAGAL